MTKTYTVKIEVLVSIKHIEAESWQEAIAFAKQSAEFDRAKEIGMVGEIYAESYPAD